MENKEQLETTTNELKMRLEDDIEQQNEQKEKLEVSAKSNKRPLENGRQKSNWKRKITKTRRTASETSSPATTKS